MKLFLASEIKHPKSLQDLSKFVRGFEGKRIVYIPTAANGTLYGSWKNGGSIKAAESLGAMLDVIELESNYEQNVIARIGQPDILWMAGGMSGYLLYWIRRVGLDKALPEILNKGAVYAASSAGAMICPKDQSLSEWYLGEPELGASLIQGLGLTDFSIYPHYEDHLYTEINNRWINGTLYLLKNGEAITMVEGKVQVLGEERVISK